MKQRRLSGVVVVGLIALIVVVAIALVRRTRDGDAIRIGVIYAGTGPASFAGAPEREVLTYLEEENNKSPAGNRRIVLEMLDSGGDKDKAISYLERFAQDQRYVAIIGPTASGESIAVAARLLDLQDKLPMLSLAASSKLVQHPKDPKSVNKWAFKFAQNDDLAARKLATVVREELADGKIAFLHSDDGFGKSGADVFVAAAKEANLQLDLPPRSFPANLTTPGAIVASLPNDIKGVVIWGSSPGPAMLVREMRDSIPTIPIYLSHGNASQDFIEAVGAKGNGVVVVGSRVLMPAATLDQTVERDRVIAQFQQFWSARSNKPQSHFAGHAYDAFEMLRTIVNNGHITREEIQAALEKTSGFPGITGTFSFSEKDHAGLDVSAFEVYRIKDDGFVPYDLLTRP